MSRYGTVLSRMWHARSDCSNFGYTSIMSVIVKTASIEMSADQMRNAVRFPLHLAARVETEQGPVDAVTEDISATGVLFNMPFAPSIDSQLRWTLRIPGVDLGSTGDVTVQCVGRVIWHGPAEQGEQVGAVIDSYHMESSHE